MSRIKVQLPPNSIAQFNIPVRITDINYGNHVGNNAIVEIIHEARVQFLNNYGFTELNVAGTALIMNELLVEFKNESFYKDLLQVKIFIGEISSKSFEIFYLITVEKNGTDKIIAKAKTGMVCYNYAEKKIETLPAKLKEILL
jgi:acyl-CoA thioester hydrolase